MIAAGGNGKGLKAEPVEFEAFQAFLDKGAGSYSLNSEGYIVVQSDPAIKKGEILMSEVDEKAYNEWRYNLPGSGWNKLIRLINIQAPKEKIDFENEFEEKLYEELWKDAEKDTERYGKWPIYDLVEIEWDDPILDIYGTSEKEYSEDRRKRGLVKS